jgi:hypothetical protein
MDHGQLVLCAFFPVQQRLLLRMWLLLRMLRQRLWLLLVVPLLQPSQPLPLQLQPLPQDQPRLDQAQRHRS